MDARSTVRFTSNIFPTSTKGMLINDRKFLDSISDPEALDILWRYNGSQGTYLNALQRKQHDAAKPCIYADRGDYPWGTSLASGRVLCLCEKTDCPLFGKCMDPQSVRRALAGLDGTVEQSTAGATVERVEQSTATVARTSVGNVRQNGKRRSVFSRDWSEQEKARLRYAYQRYDREVIYSMFAHRSAVEVDFQIDRMGLAKLPRIAKAKPKQQSNSRAQATKTNSLRGGQQQPSKKKRAKTTKNPAPWSVNEDVIIRDNYPSFGSDMTRWKKHLHGRKKGDIEKRAQELGLRFRPNGPKT